QPVAADARVAFDDRGARGDGGARYCLPAAPPRGAALGRRPGASRRAGVLERHPGIVPGSIGLGCQGGPAGPHRRVAPPPAPRAPANSGARRAGHPRAGADARARVGRARRRGLPRRRHARGPHARRRGGPAGPAHHRAMHGGHGDDPTGRRPVEAATPRMSDLALYQRLLRQARPYWLHLAGLFAIGVVASPIALLNPVPLKIVVDSVLGSRPLPAYVQAIVPTAAMRSPSTLLAVAIGLLIVVAVLAQLQALANKFVQAYVGERLVLGFRSQLVQQAQRLSLSYHDSKGTADSLY